MLAVWNMFLRLGINILLGQTKVDDVNYVLIWCAISAHEKILRLDITVDQVFAVYILDTSNLCARGNTTEQYMAHTRNKVHGMGYYITYCHVITIQYIICDTGTRIVH